MHFVGCVESDHSSARSISAHFSQSAREMGHPDLLWGRENQKWATRHSSSEAENMRGIQMESEIKIGQRFKFNLLSDSSSPERQAVVTRVLSNREEGLGPEVDYYLAYWVEAYELPETEAPTALVFERGIDGNVYFDGRQVTITLLK